MTDEPNTDPLDAIDPARQVMSDALADAAIRLAKRGYSPDTVSAAGLAVVSAMILQQHGPEGLRARLLDFAGHLEAISRPPAGRA